jgi:hypothetical protein
LKSDSPAGRHGAVQASRQGVGKAGFTGLDGPAALVAVLGGSEGGEVAASERGEGVEAVKFDNVLTEGGLFVGDAAGSSPHGAVGEFMLERLWP